MDDDEEEEDEPADGGTHSLERCLFQPYERSCGLRKWPVVREGGSEDAREEEKRDIDGVRERKVAQRSNKTTEKQDEKGWKRALEKVEKTGEMSRGKTRH